MSTSTIPASMKRRPLLHLSGSIERWISVAALSAMALLPTIDIVARLLNNAFTRAHLALRIPHVPGSTVFTQHLTLWVAFLGAMVAASSDRLLSLLASTFLSDKWAARARIFTSAVTAAICVSLAWASLQMVRNEREGGLMLAVGIPVWVAQLLMPFGFGVVALRAVWHASDQAKGRALAAVGLLIPLAFYLIQTPSSALLYIGLAAIISAVFLGLPVFAVLGGLAIILFWAVGQPVSAVPVAAYEVVSSEFLPSIPLFTLAGYLLVEGGASKRLLRVYSALFGWMPGGLAVTTVILCPMFAFAGSGVAILSLGGLLLPMFIKARYPEKFSIGLINASGSVGLLFPPSLPVILYSIRSQQSGAGGVSFRDLFIAGFFPGLLLVLLVCAYGVFQGVRCGAERQSFSFAEACRAIWEAKWELVLPVLVLYGLFGGFSTLEEAAAVTVVYAFVIECFVHRGFSLKRDYAGIVLECATVMGGVLLIIGMAKGFTNFLIDQQIPDWLSAWVAVHIHSKYLFLFLLNVFLLFKGSFMDVFSAIIVLVPLLTPIAQSFHIDPLQMGIIFLANLELGYLTPPVGINLCLAAYRFKKSMLSIYRATLPFYAILLGGVLFITYVPWTQLSLVQWLLNKLSGR